MKTKQNIKARLETTELGLKTRENKGEGFTTYNEFVRGYVSALKWVLEMED